MSEEIKVVEVERRSWYNNPEGFDKWNAPEQIKRI